MSILAARVAMAMLAAAVLGAAGWALGILATAHEPWPPQTALPAVLGVTALVLLLATVALTGRFGEVTTNGDTLTIRRVLRPRTIVPLRDVDDVVVLTALNLPSRIATAPATRVVIRRGSHTIAAVTPRDDAVVRELAGRGVPVTYVADGMGPLRAHRRHPGSVSLPEMLLAPVGWVLVAIGVLAICWLLVDTLS